VACEQIVRERRTNGELEIPAGVKELDAFYNYLNRLCRDYAAEIHKQIVNRKHRCR